MKPCDLIRIISLSHSSQTSLNKYFQGEIHRRHNVRKHTFRHGPSEDKSTCTSAQSYPEVLSVFAVRMKKHWILCYQKCAQWRFWSDWANVQSDLNLHWVHMSEGTFSDVAAPMIHNVSRVIHIFTLNIQTPSLPTILLEFEHSSYYLSCWCV